MSIDLTVDFESAGPAGTNLSAANTGFAAVTLGGGGTAVSSSTAFEGSLSGKYDAASGQTAICRDDFTARGTNADRWYGRITAAPPAFILLQQVRSSSTVRGQLRLGTDRMLSIRNGTTTVATMTTAVPTNEWFRVEWKIDNAATTQWARLFIGANVNGTTPDEEISGTFNTGTFDSQQIGILANPTAAWTLFVDHYVNDTVDWVGPESTDQTVSPTGLASTSAVGSPTVSPGEVTVSPTGVGSTAALGSPTISTGAVTVSPTGIASTAAVGSPTVTPGEVALAPVGVASTAAVGSPTVTTGPVTLSPTGIGSTTSVGTPTVTPGEVTVSPAGIPSGSAVGSPTVSVNAQTIEPTGIASASSVGSPTLTVTALPAPSREGARPGVRPRDSTRGTPGNRRRRR